MSDLDANLNVRCTAELKHRIDAAADGMGMNRSEWVLHVIETELRRVPLQGQTRPVQRTFVVAGRVPARFCTHPLRLRTERDTNGVAFCMACNSTVTQL